MASNELAKKIRNNVVPTNPNANPQQPRQDIQKRGMKWLSDQNHNTGGNLNFPNANIADLENRILSQAANGRPVNSLNQNQRNAVTSMVDDLVDKYVVLTVQNDPADPAAGTSLKIDPDELHNFNSLTPAQLRASISQYLFSKLATPTAKLKKVGFTRDEIKQYIDAKIQANTGDTHYESDDNSIDAVLNDMVNGGNGRIKYDVSTGNGEVEPNFIDKVGDTVSRNGTKIIVGAVAVALAIGMTIALSSKKDRSGSGGGNDPVPSGSASGVDIIEMPAQVNFNYGQERQTVDIIRVYDIATGTWSLSNDIAALTTLLQNAGMSPKNVEDYIKALATGGAGTKGTGNLEGYGGIHFNFINKQREKVGAPLESLDSAENGAATQEAARRVLNEVFNGTDETYWDDNNFNIGKRYPGHKDFLLSVATTGKAYVIKAVEKMGDSNTYTLYAQDGTLITVQL